MQNSDDLERQIDDEIERQLRGIRQQMAALRQPPPPPPDDDAIERFARAYAEGRLAASWPTVQ